MNLKTNEKNVTQLEDKKDIEAPNVSDIFESHQTYLTYHCAKLQLIKLLEIKLISMDEYQLMEQEIRQKLCPYLHELYPS